MKFNSNEEIQKAFFEAIKKSDENIDIGFLTDMIMYRFLSEVEILSEERKMTRKELAQKIGTSASYLTQLYRGNKLLNLTTIAKFEKVFDITFEIKATPNFHQETTETNDQKTKHLPAIKMNRILSEKINAIQKQLVQEPPKKYQIRKRFKQ